MEDFELDFADTAVGDVRDPYPEYEIARVADPVSVQEFNGDTYVKVYRYDGVEQVLRDPDTFSSDAYRSFEKIWGPTILAMNGAEHRVHRGLVAGAFRRKAMESWESTLIVPAVDSLIDRFAARGEADLVKEFTFRFPIRVISGILGIPSGDEARFARLSLELISWGVDYERGKAAAGSLREVFAGLLRQRRENPRDDLISALATAEIDGTRLDDQHIFGFLSLLLPAGAETTYRLIGSLMYALLSDPASLKAVDADRSLVAKAIEEALRWESPVQFVARLAMRDARIGGVDVPAGTPLSLVIGSSNRDEAVFDDPDEFRLDRRGPAPHLAFADGPHRCLGEHLARMETTVAVNRLLDRLPNLRLNPGDRDPHIHGWAFRSPNCLPVAFDA